MNAGPIDYATARPGRRRRGDMRHPAIVALLLLVGGQLWLLCDPALVRPFGYVVAIGIAIGVGCVPAVQRGVAAMSRWLGQAGVGASASRFALVSTLAGVALYAIAVKNGRTFAPAVHDEFSYLLQARMIAEGHLWLPAHPLADFFDTFYVITDRAYASQYFPGAAILYAIPLLAGATFWTGPLVASALACGAAFLVLRELFDGATALVGVAFACGVVGFRYVSISAYAQPPTMLWTLLAIWCALRWDRDRRIAWIVAMAAAIGAAAITRPPDALVFGACAAGLVAWRSRGERFATWRRLATAGALPLVPFLALQLVVNHGVTGRWFQTPFGYYAARDMPGSELGFRAVDPLARPASIAPEKQRFYADRIVPLLRVHTPAGVWHDWSTRLFHNLAIELLPDVLFIVALPASLLALADARRAVVALALPLWWFAYAFHPFTFFHYYVVLIVPAATIVFAGFDVIARGSPRRARRAVRTSLLAVTAVVAVMSLPMFHKDADDGPITNRVEAHLRSLVATIAEPRAIVLIRDAPTASPEQAVLFNIERAWPDDARAIRARDLGDRDVELYRYYAARQPDRAVYRFDRAGETFQRLGNVADLAAAATTRR